MPFAHFKLSFKNPTHALYLVKIFTCGSHLLPGFVEQLNADAEEFLKGAIVGEEHGVEVVAVFTGCGDKRHSQTEAATAGELGLLVSDGSFMLVYTIHLFNLKKIKNH